MIHVIDFMIPFALGCATPIFLWPKVLVLANAALGKIKARLP